jgi:hypothetical protein
MTCFSRLKTAALLLGTTSCLPNFSAPRIPKVHPWFTGFAGQGNLPTAAVVSTWLGVLFSDLAWFYPGGQCLSCCGERAHVLQTLPITVILAV